MDTQNLGSLGAVKDVGTLDDLVVGIGLANGNVRDLGEPLVEDIAVVLGSERTGTNNESLATGFRDGESPDVTKSD